MPMPSLHPHPGATMPASPSASVPLTRTRRVVDAPTRMWHVLFALSFVGAYLTAERESWRALHTALGYTFMGLLGFRLLYGLWGPRPVRWSALVGKLRGAPAWGRGVWGRVQVGQWPTAAQGRQAQNLLMAGAVAGVLLLAVPLLFSGWAADHSWAWEWVSDVAGELHEGLGEALLAVVLAHVGLVLGVSLLRRQNLARGMLDGRAPGTGPDVIAHNRRWLAALLLLAVLAWGGWNLWQPSPSATAGAPTVEMATATRSPRLAHTPARVATQPRSRQQNQQDDD